MADLIQDRVDDARGATPEDLTTLVELLFFAYRDFTGEADAILAEFGLGRAHHRVLHFVRRHPGLRVTDLLAILKITKQSLARVLTPLVADGWIDSRKDPDDQRARMLHLTAKGTTLATRLVESQAARVANAMTAAADGGKPDEQSVRGFLLAMIAADDRREVLALLKTARPETAVRSARSTR